MSSAEFYRELKTFRGFVEGVIDDGHYAPVPEDWLIAVADVVNSTRAVKTGKYHEVNYLGATVIVAAGNAVPDYSLASVFGGDGATLVIPPEAESRVGQALLATKRWGKDAFGLDLRVGLVSMSELTRFGAWLMVAKMQLSRGNDMAMFRGNALDIADHLVKKGDGDRSFELREPVNEHVHFIDGGEGGLWCAAESNKSQIKQVEVRPKLYRHPGTNIPQTRSES